MKLLSLRTIAPGLAALSLGAAAVLPFQAKEADAAMPRCFIAGLAKGWMREAIEWGDTFWFQEYLYAEEYVAQYCGGGAG